MNRDMSSRLTITGASMEKQTLSICEAGKVLGIGRSAAYAAARTGELPTIKIGRRLLVPIVALERWLEEAGRPIHSQSPDSGRGADCAP